MRRIWALLALAFATALHASVPSGSIENFIENEMSVSAVPGLAYAVIEDGELIDSGEYGVSEEGGPAISPGTTFIIGSVSKSFTALAVMQLVEADKIGLDAPISQYLPEFKGRPSGTITPRQLLSHTSGYSIYQGNLSQTDITIDSEALTRRVANVAAMEPAHAAGTRWDYSNANYQVLGRLVEVVSGQDYPTYVESNILQPLEMTDSYVHSGEKTASLATGHQPWFGGKRPLEENLTGVGSAPQGGVVASARDLSRYMAMMMNGEDDILSAEGKARMMSPASEASPNYGFGWFLEPENGVVSHSGSNPGYETMVTMVPTEKKGAVVVVNGGSGTGFGDTNQLRYGLNARTLGIEHGGSGQNWSAKVTFLGLVALPIIYLVSMIWAWRKRDEIRAKKGRLRTFSLWFPLVMMLALAWVIFKLVPSLFGAPFGTIQLFQPDMALVMASTAVMGVAWAIFRLVIGHTSNHQQR